MPDTNSKDAAADSAVQSDANTSVPANNAAPETAEKHHARLAESALESSLSDVLPLSPIGGSESENSATKKREKKSGGRRGLRRGASGKSQNAPQASSGVGIVENPAEFTETLSGNGPKPSPRRERFERGGERVPAEKFVPANEFVSPEEKIEEMKPGAGWSIQEKKERNFRHFQSNAGANRPKLIIEPAQIPEQEAEPSFWEKLKNRILSIFKINKKKGKKRRGNRGGKFRGDRRDGKDFHRNGGYNKNKNNRGGRTRNSGYRGNRGNNRGNGGNAPSGE